MNKYIGKQTLEGSTRSLYNDIDDCITDLLKARVSKDTEVEGKALFKMESLMVATLQQLSCVLDFLQQEQPKEKLDIDTLHEWSMRYVPDIRESIEATAYHFWNLATARKEE